MEDIQKDIDKSHARIDELMMQLQRLQRLENDENKMSLITMMQELPDKQTIGISTNPSTNTYYPLFMIMVIIVNLLLFVYMLSSTIYLMNSQIFYF